MKKGDWVLIDGEISQITLVDYLDPHETGRWHLVNIPSLSFAALRSEKDMTPVAKPVSDILTAVKQHESE